MGLNVSQCVETLKTNTSFLESRLIYFLGNSEVEYMRNWAFELADREAELAGVERHGSRYEATQVLRRNEVMAMMYGDIMKVIKENRGHLPRLEVVLPTYASIEGILKKIKEGLEKHEKRT